MLSRFQASYQRVETSLQKLTDSIAAYNPSITAADELVAADEAVNANIDQLVQHQKNHQRILSLRQTSEALDESLKSTLRLLAETRKEIQAIPSASSSSRREVTVDELLDYAKFIACTTVPPTFRRPIPDDLLPKKQAALAVQPSNGMVTPPQASAGPLIDSLAIAADDSNPNYDQSTSPAEENLAVKAMEDREKAFIIPQNLPFEPWPNHTIIMRGSLADIQRLAESGVDPASILSREEKAEAERLRKEREEEEAREAEIRERKRREVWSDQAARRPTVADNKPFNPDDL
ncbi:mediator of rna polymerase ii transcription subunit 4 like protein [Zymoseptoria brevis]|uniref:Mediator of RNA polymerase II transcription subunit 4 n=1 Tax=Zymoseptoria brevis TaxID=1047168 RepID=A0A0F4GS46_9PEZI|nr:mediator of rna polymerase ii transcription subunit 4 like protein [Zymoseptoria brevis]